MSEKLDPASGRGRSCAAGWITATGKLNNGVKRGRNEAIHSKDIIAQQTPFLLPTLAEQCDPRQPLKQLADTLPLATLETAFA